MELARKELPFYLHFWVQVHGLPNFSFTQQNAFMIGHFLGEYLCVDKTVWGKFMRIRVRLDIKNPLVTGFWVMPNIWIPFKYENLGLFCYKCGRIGNHQNTCKFPPGNEKFGPWLRVESSGFRRVMEENKNSMIVVEKENFTLIPSPNLLAWPEVEDDLENTTPPMNEWARLMINGVDSIIMMVNCAVIAYRVAEANEVKGYGWLIVMMAAYFFYLMLKFNVMVQRIDFFCSGGSTMVEYSQVSQLKDLLILLMFCVVFLVSC
ncbi:hypothetical protein H5410_047792 [Solanum commersonii]|uniref:Zinc knuckle CX2CX4HX4C domain-containing protein n=1 Tax=Solanum commersonii TaxID=4109 RepID=A0A9J5XJR3_SOLCO|nr:hypothetical protein H5410_047792 [Solanum commersonii]